MSAIRSLRSFAIPNRPVAWLIVPLAAALIILEYDLRAFVTPLAVAVAFWILARSAHVARTVRIPRGRWLSGAALLSAAAALVPAATFTAWARYRMSWDPYITSPYIAMGPDTSPTEVTPATFTVVAVVLFACAWAGIALGTIHARHGFMAALGTLVACVAALILYALFIPEAKNPGAHMSAPVPAVFVFLLPLAAIGFLVAVAQTRRAA
ncbi:hypothetical protein [Corynebacterium sp. 335C]